LKGYLLLSDTLKEFMSDPRFLKLYQPLVEELVAKTKEEVYKRPKQGTEDIRKDFRYRLGLIAGVELVLKLNEEVRNGSRTDRTAID
jgi:hypothetical protein